MRARNINVAGNDQDDPVIPLTRQNEPRAMWLETIVIVVAKKLQDVERRNAPLGIRVCKSASLLIRLRFPALVLLQLRCSQGDRNDGIRPHLPDR
jgi:hypothetical protein